MINNEVYESLLVRIFENEMVLYGILTIDIFRKVNGVDISGDGKVITLVGDFKNIIQDLVAEYIKFDGDLSLKLIRSIIEAYRSSYSDVDFPAV